MSGDQRNLNWSELGADRIDKTDLLDMPRPELDQARDELPLQPMTAPLDRFDRLWAPRNRADA